MKKVYVEILQRAADLRNAGLKDQRLDILDEVLAENGATIEAVGRTGSSNDTHFCITVSDETDERNILELPATVHEVVAASISPFKKNWEKVSEFKGELQERADTKEAFWMECLPRKEISFNSPRYSDHNIRTATATVVNAPRLAFI